tara:strand:+ start:530 stop:904 length:375 start_codon:yes stop_codon:yes gene_type:complete
MNKFLKLVEETNPKVGYIIDIKDSDHNLLGSAAIPGSTNTSFYEEFTTYLRNVHEAEVVGVNTRRPVEDYEDEDISDEDRKVINDVENAAELGNKQAERVVKQTGQEKDRKFNQVLNQYKQLNR